MESRCYATSLGDWRTDIHPFVCSVNFDRKLRDNLPSLCNSPFSVVYDSFTLCPSYLLQSPLSQLILFYSWPQRCRDSVPFKSSPDSCFGPRSTGVLPPQLAFKVPTGPQSTTAAAEVMRLPATSARPSQLNSPSLITA